MISPADLREAADDVAMHCSVLNKLEDQVSKRELLTLNYNFTFFLIDDGSVAMFADQLGTACVYYGTMMLTDENAVLSEISAVLESTNYMTYSELEDVFTSFEDGDMTQYAHVPLYEAIVNKALKNSVRRILICRTM